MNLGLANYISLSPPVYPPIVDEWNSIPASQIATFTPDGFNSRQCFTGMGDILQGWAFTTPQTINSAGTGLGDFALTAPGGFFATGDFTQWGIAEWGAIGLGIYAGLSLIGDTKRHVRKARKASKAYRSAS